LAQSNLKDLRLDNINLGLAVVGALCDISIFCFVCRMKIASSQSP